jgi:carboxynorspermidine decarboxylase
MRLNELPTPCFLVDEKKLEDNLRVLRGVMERTGCRILLAQKAFSMFALYPLVGRYLSGTAASGLYEARLGAIMGGENHVFCTAFREDEFAEVAGLCGHIIFNSLAQLKRFGPIAQAAGKSIGLRVNPECSTQEGHAIYDPCAPGSRLGVTLAQFEPELLAEYGVEGLHMHTLCEQDADALAATVKALEERFGGWMHGMKWLNLGGGHHITRRGYDTALLEETITRLSKKYAVQVYLEPGEAVALDAGLLLTRVLDIVENGGVYTAILDASAACHMPDVLEMPYRPPLLDAAEPGEKPHTYRLAGPTCLAGDVIGDYSFEKPLQYGDLLQFGDMAIYSMVKTNTFNGMPLPAIAIKGNDGDCRIIKTFGYEDFKGRLS